MALENKKLKQKHDHDLLNKQTVKDKQNTNKNSTLENAIIAGLVIGGGYGLYRSGVLRTVFGSLKEAGAAFAEMSSNEGYRRSKVMKDWALGNTKEFLRPDHSLFNSKKVSSLGYDLWQDLKESFARKELYTTNIRRVINDTVTDVNILTQMLQKETKGYSQAQIINIRKTIEESLAGQGHSQNEIDKIVKERIQELQKTGERYIKTRNTSLRKSDIVQSILTMNNITQDISNNKLGSAGNKASANLMKDFVESLSLSDETAQAQLKRTNYRALLLGDIFETFDKQKHELVFKEGLNEKILFDKYNLNINETIGQNGKTIKSTIEEFLSDARHKYADGNRIGTLGNFDDVWKRFIIDKSININEQQDKIINYMMGKDALSFFSDSLRKDFGLPVLGFNPIDSMIKVTPFDNIFHRRDVPFALINGVDAYSPYISGQGSRLGDDISTSLQKKFNKPDETFHLLFSRGNLYALGTEGTEEFLGSGYHAWDITNADKEFKLPHSVAIMRTMGGYDLNRDSMNEAVSDTVKQIGDKAKKYYSPNLTAEEYEAVSGFTMSPIERIRNKFGRHFDIGFQEFKNVQDLKSSMYFDYGEMSNVDNLFDDLLYNATRSNAFRTNNFQFKDYDTALSEIRDKSYNMAFGKGFDDYITKNGVKIRGKNIVITKQGKNIQDLFQDITDKNTEKFTEDIKEFVGQLFAGFDAEGNMNKYFNESSSMLYDVFNALDTGLATVNLGLSLDSKHSTKDLVQNLLLKRALPVYMLTQVPGMIDYFSEPIFTNNKEKKEGKTDTLTKTLMRDIVKPIDIGIHGIGDTLGFTKIFKYLQEMTPGSDNFTELPIIYQLGLGQTAEERKEYIEKGYDPIRKNRYWSVSNTPFTGAKIDHWRPNIYRRIEADTKFSDTMYGSRKEYYQNVWYPNLVSPLAPIRHFITDPHHWDKKHRNDRPYPETAPKGENIPLIGPLVSGTIGQIYRKKMHKEYWNPDGTLKPVNPQDEKPSQLLMTGQSSNFAEAKGGFISDIQKAIERAFVDTSTFNQINARTQEQYHKAAGLRLQDLFLVQQILNNSTNAVPVNNTFSSFKQTPLYDNALRSYTVAYNNGQATPVRTLPYSNLDNFRQTLFTKAKEYSSPLQTSSLPYRDYDRYNTALDVYVTPSGSISIVDVPENLNLYKVNEEIKHYSLNKIYGTNQRVDINEYERGYQQQEPIKANNDILWNIGEEFNDIGNIYGLKGFLIQSMFTGTQNVGSVKVENSSYTYSANRSFWDTNLGGLGGELSEIARRFIHKKDKNTEYLNPIRNTMPTWMPGSNYFIDYLHGDPYSKIMNGEERLPGDAYEKLNNIDFSFNISASMLVNSRSAHVRHFLHQDTNLTYEQENNIKALKKDKRPQEIINDKYEIQDLHPIEEFVSRILDNFRDNKVLLKARTKFHDEQHDITGVVDAVIKDYHSSTGKTLINIRGVDSKEFETLKKGHNVRNQDYYEMNYDLYAMKNTKGRGYIYYYNQDNPEELYKARIKFNKKDLRSSIQNLNDAKMDIYNGIKSGEISRGDLYSLVDKYKILADTAPYSQEFKDISSQISHAHLTEKEKREVKAARERMQEQKEPLRVYDYKFKTSNLKSEKVTVKDIIDNNTIIVNEYGKEHAIKFAGINVSESNSTLYAPTVKEKKEKNKKTGKMRTKRTGKTMNEAANDELRKYLKPGQSITIQYDADERNKYNKDSTQSIRAIVNVKGTNLNRRMLKKGLAKEKENDNSPAGIHARYSEGSIAFGSMMETLTHSAAKLPFIGDKFFQIRSPYEQYRKREVYNKDFKSWSHPIRDYVIPTTNELSSMHPIGAIMVGAFLGSMTGKNPYGKFVGAIFGATIPAIGTTIHHLMSDKDREFRPKRRRQQEEMNTYIDTLKYVKNTKLYNKYKELAKKRDHFDVEAYIEKQEQKGKDNKAKRQELNNYKRLVKLDFKHRGNYNFKYGSPKYEEKDQSKKEVIRAINRELAEISNDRKVEKLPLNAIKAISYKQAADRTMYGYEPGDDIRNIMSALPKKERQYYSKLVEAPEEEKQKILRIAPSYLRRALQASWGMHVDEKPSLTEYFQKHALPDENWSGWNEESNLDHVKIKMVGLNNLDPGEFDIWTDNKREADETNIPIPKLNIKNDPKKVQAQLTRLLNNTGMDNVNVSYMNGINNDFSTFNIQEDSRNEVSNQIRNLNYY